MTIKEDDDKEDDDKEDAIEKMWYKRWKVSTYSI